MRTRWRHPATALLFVLGAAVPLHAAAPPGAEPTPATPIGPRVTLSGAFGTVPGTDPSAPATAYPGVALDAFVRAAPLRLDVEEPRDGLLAVEVRSYPDDGRPDSLLSGHDGTFAGPDVVGGSVIVARVLTREHGATEHAWLLEVPDRWGGWETLLQLVPPAIMVGSQQAEVRGVPGNGCYVYLCSDVGGLGPPDTMTALAAAAGEPLTVRTADGSGLSGWSGILREIDGSDPPITAAATASTPASHLRLTGLEPPARGEWLLELRVELDRQRGDLWQAYRIVAD